MADNSPTELTEQQQSALNNFRKRNRKNREKKKDKDDKDKKDKDKDDGEDKDGKGVTTVKRFSKVVRWVPFVGTATSTLTEAGLAAKKVKDKGSQALSTMETINLILGALILLCCCCLFIIISLQHYIITHPKETVIFAGCKIADAFDLANDCTDRFVTGFCMWRIPGFLVTSEDLEELEHEGCSAVGEGAEYVTDEAF